MVPIALPRPSTAVAMAAVTASMVRTNIAGLGAVCGGSGTCNEDGECVCAPCYTRHPITGVCTSEPDPDCGV